MKIKSHSKEFISKTTEGKQRAELPLTQTRSALANPSHTALQPHLACGHQVSHRMHGQAEDVVVVTQVEALRVLLPVINDSHRCHVVHDLTSLSVKQITSAVITSVTKYRKHIT